MSRSSLTLHNGGIDDIADDEATVAATTTTTTTPEQPEEIICSRCRKPATFMCSSCGLNGPRYCSVECQKIDWKESHYKICEATLAARRSRRATQTSGTDQRTSRLSAALAVNSRSSTGKETRQDDRYYFFFADTHTHRIARPEQEWHGYCNDGLGWIASSG
ncbi:hypothetical protein BJV82DRAFT_212293 [Fennellomyces sp. T-0311]|nr:hypothetical protein BJV82DRAFT_212293 [Fennellomyces sp. T-0311]